MKQAISTYYFITLSLCYLILLRNHKYHTLSMVYCRAPNWIIRYITWQQRPMQMWMTGLLGYNYCYLHLKPGHWTRHWCLQITQFMKTVEVLFTHQRTGGFWGKWSSLLSCLCQVVVWLFPLSLVELWPVYLWMQKAIGQLEKTERLGVFSWCIIVQPWFKSRILYREDKARY